MTALTETEARKQLYGLLDSVAESHEPVQIAGKRHTAVLVAEDDLDSARFARDAAKDSLTRSVMEVNELRNEIAQLENHILDLQGVAADGGRDDRRRDAAPGRCSDGRSCCTRPGPLVPWCSHRRWPTPSSAGRC